MQSCVTCRKWADPEFSIGEALLAQPHPLFMETTPIPNCSFLSKGRVFGITPPPPRPTPGVTGHAICIIACGESLSDFCSLSSKPYMSAELIPMCNDFVYLSTQWVIEFACIVCVCVYVTGHWPQEIAWKYASQLMVDVSSAVVGPDYARMNDLLGYHVVR